ncbi:MAG: ribose-phosphate pyrophosphokinase [Erysipelotrichaceae bacterium]|nr:ribose-phosphate pyrophosphokinase [Erysipelotrichaceae bacterium]MBQ4254168.1 ribose-phosphate pyrophosphokinase [Erysipelotrichaceae bacterium]
MKNKDSIMIFSLTSSKHLTEEIVKLLGVREGNISVTHFADGEVIVEPQESVRGKHVFIVQSTCKPVNERLMEVLVCLDAVKRASCAEATVVIPYYGYARQDRKAKPRQPITSRLVADLLQAAGADRVVCIDLHATQIQGFFKIPTDNLTAVALMAQYFRKKKLENFVVVSPDHGGVTRARELAVGLGNAPIAIVDKRRSKPNEAEAMNLIGDVSGKDVIIVDDLVDTGGSLIGGMKMLIEKGAKDIYCCATHGVFSKNALENIQNSPAKEFVVTNTIELTDEQKAKCPKIHVVSVGPLLAKGIEAIADGSPISDVYSLFSIPENQTGASKD